MSWTVRAFLAALLITAACGDEGSPIVDAAPTDTPNVDSEVTEADAESGVVRVTLYDFGRLVADAPVYFQNADSSLVAAARTGVDGSAQATMMPGGYVSVLVPPSLDVAAAAGPTFSGDRVVTFAGVKPGDQLVVGVLVPARTTFDITFPVEPQSTNFNFYSTCGENFIQVSQPSPDPVMAFVVLTPCANDRADFALIADGGASGIPLGLVARDVPVVVGQGITLTGTWAPLHSNTVTYTGLDPRVVEVDLEQRLVTPRGRLDDLSFTSGLPSAGTASVPGAHAMAPATGLVQVNVARFVPDSGFSQSVVASWGPHAATTTVAPAPALLHAYTAFPEFDLANHRVQWSEAAAGVTADFAVASVVITRTLATRSWQWDIVGPRAAAELVLPVLPTDIIDFNPVATDSASVDQLYTYQVPGGYDAARAHAFTNDLAGLATMATGRVVREELFFQPL